jgi:hypothetical protein
MKVKQILEARYQKTNAKSLDGWFIAGKNVQQITIMLSDCQAQRARNETYDSICKIVDYDTSGPGWFSVYRDGLKPGTEVIFGQGETQDGERRWYVMPTSDAEVVGWFIRGPNYLDDINEAKYHGVDQLVDCPNCLGRGWDYYVVDAHDVEKDICHFCDGEGRVREEKVLALQKRQAEARMYRDYD